MAKIVENQVRDAVAFHRAGKRDHRLRVAFEHRGPDESAQDFDPAAKDTQAVERLLREEHEAALDKAMEQLTKEQREVIRLRVEGLSFAAIAVAIGRPTPRAAEAFYLRSRERLAELMKAWRKT